MRIQIDFMDEVGQETSVIVVQGEEEILVDVIANGNLTTQTYTPLEVRALKFMFNQLQLPILSSYRVQSE